MSNKHNIPKQQSFSDNNNSNNTIHFSESEVKSIFSKATSKDIPFMLKSNILRMIGDFMLENPSKSGKYAVLHISPLDDSKKQYVVPLNEAKDIEALFDYTKDIMYKYQENGILGLLVYSHSGKKEAFGAAKYNLISKILIKPIDMSALPSMKW